MLYCMRRLEQLALAIGFRLYIHANLQAIIPLGISPVPLICGVESIDHDMSLLNGKWEVFGFWFLVLRSFSDDAY